MIPYPEPTFIVVPNDTVPGVRALVAYPSGIRVDVVPAGCVTAFKASLRGRISASYCKIAMDEDGRFLGYEGETGDFNRRLGEHAPFGNLPADAILVFTGPGFNKDVVEGLQWLMCDQLAINGHRIEDKPSAHRPQELIWSVIEYTFGHIRNLTKRLGFTFFDNPPGVVPGLHLIREIEDRPDADEIWDYRGGYPSAAAQVGAKLLLLRHSQIRASSVPIARPSYKHLRESLIRERGLVLGPRGTLVTTRDLVFPSLDAAGKFVRGDYSGSKTLWMPRRLSVPTR